MVHQFTARDVQLVIANPIYTGMGQYERIIDDNLWVGSALRAIQERGAYFWSDVQTNVVEALGLSENKVSDICSKAQDQLDKATKDIDRQRILKGLLLELRKACK